MMMMMMMMNSIALELCLQFTMEKWIFPTYSFPQRVLKNSYSQKNAIKEFLSNKWLVSRWLEKAVECSKLFPSFSLV
jgi:hypothetical protein